MTGSGAVSGAPAESESVAAKGVGALEAVGGSGVIAGGADGAPGSDGNDELVTRAARAGTAEAAVVAIETARAAGAEKGIAGADAAAGVM